MVDSRKPSLFSFLSVSAVMLDDGSVVTILAPQERMRYREIAAAVLGITTDSSPEMAGDLLIKRNHVLSEAQSREAERKMGTLILPEDGNIVFFLKTVHSKDSVMVSFGGFWSGYSCFLGDDVRCHTDDRVFLRNFDASRYVF